MRMEKLIPFGPVPAWLPNWRDAGNYINHGDDYYCWAWEFLRRNPEYRADFRRWAELPDSEGNQVSPKWKGGWTGYGMQYFHVPSDWPTPLPSETMGEYNQRTGEYPDTLREHLEKHWNLERLVDPDKEIDDDFGVLEIDRPPTFLDQRDNPHGLDWHFLAKSFGPPVRWECREVIRAPWHPDEDKFKMVVAFDKRYPLESQFDEVKRSIKDDRDSHTELLEREREGNIQALHYDSSMPKLQPPRPTPTKLLDYLRAYDAEWSEGWRRQEFAAVLFPAKKRDKDGDKSGLDAIDDARSPAHYYVMSGWRELMRWAGYPKNLKKPRNS